MSRIFAITKILLFALLAGMTSTAFAQSDDFTTSVSYTHLTLPTTSRV